MPAKTVLIVDDDSLFSWALRKELSFHCLDTRIARTGQACLAAVREKRYDLLFLDIHLPDRNGIELLKTLRKISPDTCIVIVSWNGDIQNKEAALSEGAEQFLEKPFDITVVTRLLSSALRKGFCQRRHMRYFCTIPLRLSILEPAPEEAQFFLGAMRGTAEDVGAGGIRLNTDYPLRTGQGVLLRIDGEPDPFGKLIGGNAFAEVVWAVYRDDLSTAGLRFLAEPPHTA
jgi:two-component system, chemotaxis family, chemotaxis protein CheY